MPQASVSPPWFVRKDLDGFFSLMIDNLIQLILIVTLCRELIHLPTHIFSVRFCRAPRSQFPSAIFSTPGRRSDRWRRPDLRERLRMGLRILKLYFKILKYEAYPANPGSADSARRARFSGAGPDRAAAGWKNLAAWTSFPEASYFLLEDPDIVARLKADPHGFLDAVKTPAILDEVQNVPEVFTYVRTRIDRQPRRSGQWLLTGSQEAPLMQSVTESMAGRAAVLHLLPFSTRETPGVSLLRGGYPEVVARPQSARLWFSSYLQTYLERDVRAVTAVKDLATFRRFLALVASRHGQVLNRTALAAPLGVSVPTVSQWLGVLETTAQILLVPPFYENLGKRLIKSPKVYVADSGLACHLLGIDSPQELAKSPFRGALFEGFVAAEIVKSQAGLGRRREIYFFRDEQGLEVDFLVPGPSGSVSLVECKAARTITPFDAAPMQRLAEALRKQPRRARAELNLVYQGPKSPMATRAVAPGVRSWTAQDFLQEL